MGIARTVSDRNLPRVFLRKDKNILILNAKFLSVRFTHATFIFKSEKHENIYFQN
jgi:hypothetical protein